MLANFFNKSKPINFIIIVALFFLYFILASYQQFDSTISIGLFLVNKTGAFFAFLCLFFFFNFIVSKNNLTFDNTYAFLFFVIFLGLFPNTISITKVFFSNFVLFLFLRKVYSLRKPKATIQKLFDGGFWLGIAFLIDPLSFIFLTLFYVSILLFHKITIQTLLTPIIGLLVPIFLYFTYCFWNDLISDFQQLFFSISLNDFYSLNNSKQLFSIVLLGIFTLFFILIKTPKALSVSNSFKKTWILILLHLIITTICLFFFTKASNENRIVYLLFPIAIIFANGIEIIQKKWIKEIVLLLFLISSFAVHFL